MDKFLFLFGIIFCVTGTNSLHTDAQRPSRILNGRPAAENQFPFMVSLQRLSGIHSANRGHRCGGVLVTLQHALTAASCTLDFGNGQMTPIDRDEYRVFAGSVLLTNDTSADRVRRIANTTAHPDYNVAVNYYIDNIAVIILGTPFLSNTVAPAAIINIGNDDMVTGTIVGWGRETQLMQAPMLAPNRTICQRLVGQSLPNLFCGWGPSSTISISGYAGCEGDQGGPFISLGEVAGLIVDTRGCSTSIAMPHWYLRVFNYVTWIDSVVGLPVPELGPEPPTEPPPTTTSTTTTPAPGAASTFQPGLAILAVIVVAHITANVIH